MKHRVDAEVSCVSTEQKVSFVDTRGVNEFTCACRIQGIRIEKTRIRMTWIVRDTCYG